MSIVSRPGTHRPRLQVELEASHEELQMAKSELEATQLKMEHTEAGWGPPGLKP